MNDFYEDIIILLIVPVCIFFMLMLGSFAVSAGIDYLDCRGFQKGTGIETRYEWGCYANVDGRWVPKAYAFGSANEFRIKEVK